MDIIAGSEQIHLCYTEQWFRYANGRRETEQDVCNVYEIGAEFAQSGDIRDLLVAIATSDGFMYRRTEAPAGDN